MDIKASTYRYKEKKSEDKKGEEAMRADEKLCLCRLALALSGCETSGQYDDLTQYMDEVRARPRGKIEPLPDFAPYEAFSYSAAGQRSPFDEPILNQRKRDNQFNRSVPDAAR